MSDIKRFGVVFKKYRKLKKLSTQELADKVNVSVGFINNIENGRVDAFKLNLLNKLVIELNIPLDEVFSNIEVNSIELENAEDILKISLEKPFLIGDGCLTECIGNFINELINFLRQFDDEEEVLRIIITHFIDSISIMKRIYNK